MRERILSIVVLIAVLVSGFGTAYAQTQTSFEADCKTLFALGILDTDSKKPDSFVTRGEFISAAVALRGTEKAGAEVSFSDLKSNHKYYRDIVAAYALGLVEGTDGKIMPDDVITSGQVGIILMRVLGYTAVGGSDIDNLSALASRKGLLCGESNMTWENVVKILMNVLDEQTVNANYDGSAAVYDKTGMTAAEDYLSVYEYDGVLNGVGDMYISGSSYLGGNEADIGGTVYKIGDLVPQESLGRRVKGYYKYDSDSDENVLLTINDYNNKLLVIDAEDLKSYQNHKIEYYDGTKTKTAATDINLDVLYNYRGCDNFKADDMMIQNGTVSLIDNNNDGKYDVAVIVSYDIYVIDSVDSHNQNIYLKYFDKNYVVSLNNNDKTVELSNESGYDVDIRELTAGDVMCVYASKDGEYIRGVQCIHEIRGELSQIEEDGGKTYITVDNERYNLSQECRRYQAAQLRIGISASFVLDVNGKIAYIKQSSSNTCYAYVINTMIDEEEDCVYFKLMLDDGSFIKAAAGNKCTVDGVSYNDAAILWGAIGGKDFGHQLIKCLISIEGKIKKIETAGGMTSSDCLEMYYTDYDYSTGIPVRKKDSRKHYYKSYSNIIGNRVHISSSDTVIMVVPDGNQTDEKYYKVQSDYFKDDIEYYLEAYRTNKESYTADVVVVYDDVSSDYSISDQNVGISVLDKYNLTVDDDNETAYMVSIFDNGSYQKYMTKDADILQSVYGGITPTRGDIIRYEVKDNRINKLELIYSAQKREMVAGTSVTNRDSNNYYTQFRVWDAYVFYRWGSNVLLSKTRPTEYENYNYGDYDLHTCIRASIVVCNTEDAEIYGGTFDDLIGFVNTKGGACSEIVAYERYGECKTIVIYK